VIYLRSIGDKPGLSVLDVDTGEILNFIGMDSQMYFPVGGPGDTIFVGVNDEVWQIYPDGSHDIWGLRDNAWPRFYTIDGRMLGASGSSVVEMFPSGEERLIADGFIDIFDIAADEQGNIFVADFISGDLVRIDLSGEKRTLIEGMIYKDEINLTISPGGQLYLNCYNVGFVRVDTETGSLTHFANLNGDVVFSAPDEVLFTDASESQVYRFNLISGAREMIVSNGGLYSRAVAIGPDDSLYVGIWGTKNNPARVVRFSDDGTQEIVVDGLIGSVHDIAFDEEGGLYVVSRKYDQYRIFYQSPARDSLVAIPGSGGPSAIAVDPKTGHVWASFDGGILYEYSLNGLIAQHRIEFPKEPHEFYIDFAPDGTLYAFTFELERARTGPEVDRWILRLNPEDGSSEIVAQHNRQGCCTFGNLGVDIYGTIWWVLNPEFEIYRVNANGEINLFAKNLPTDPGAVIADSEGDVYFTSPAGIIRIYQEK
jgi:DNA-binding beta-propeller fold protein YncE